MPDGHAAFGDLLRRADEEEVAATTGRPPACQCAGRAVPSSVSRSPLRTAYAAHAIDVRTAASPPWRQTLGLTASYVTGPVLSLSCSRTASPATGL
jgi:hypothetical protein